MSLRAWPMFFITLTLLTLPTWALPLHANTEQTSSNAIIKSASELDYPPFCIVRPDGTADGFSVDLLKAVASVMGRNISFEVGPWNELKEKLATGQLDVLPLVGYSQERDVVYDFTVPYLIMHGEIFVRKENKKTIRSLADLKGKEVAVMKGDNVQEWAVNQHLGADLILTTTFTEAFQLLARGKHDAVLAQKVMGLQLIKQLGLTNIVTVGDPREDIGELKPTRITTPGFEQKFCFAVVNGNKNLLDQLNEGLAIVVANSTYARLYQKWFEPILPPRPVPRSMLVKNTLLALVPIVFILVLVWLFLVKREVARKTQSLRAEIMERQKAEEKKTEVIAKLQHAVDEIKTLRGILPLCSFCKKIRDDQGYWEQVDVYIHKHAGAQISHSVCPDCLQEHYPAEYARIQKTTQES
ncbi:MAG: transporter substrate-binding domain-containing protein [Proteobacteria bacterium]|nr:transporter substrate-binding domain-containing protein [Pseudomonadota bacterium]MBU1640621.1 transporter substrate-binding domain-containing protein [Pseudomonadota bacterium]